MTAGAAPLLSPLRPDRRRTYRVGDHAAARATRSERGPSGDCREGAVNEESTCAAQAGLQQNAAR